MRKQTEQALARRQSLQSQRARDSAEAWHALITESVERDIAESVRKGVIKPEEAQGRLIALHCARIDRFMAAVERAENERAARLEGMRELEAMVRSAV